MSIGIRPMSKKDKPEIMEILRHTPEFNPAEVMVAEELLDSYLRDGYSSGYSVLIAEVNSSVVGYICYGPTPLTEGTWDLYWAAVAREEQGKGIGKALLIQAENDIKKQGGRLAIIETSSKPEYEKTRQFHHSNGYQIVGRIADFYAPGDDKLIFSKRLK
ncbi:MAG: GNAT family N-acetyltransferase [Dehalococcoidia bacterium]|nr:GNAT family N-acetyltransferase [Dehalococcoidia bacterium]